MPSSYSVLVPVGAVKGTQSPGAPTKLVRIGLLQKAARDWRL